MKMETLRHLKSQLESVLSRYVSKLDRLQRECGVKDKYFTIVVEKWNEEVDKKMPKKKGVSAADREMRASILGEQCRATPEDPFNPLLQIDGNSSAVHHRILLSVFTFRFRPKCGHSD